VSVSTMKNPVKNAVRHGRKVKRTVFKDLFYDRKTWLD
jgi:hypothetical protein